MHADLERLLSEDEAARAGVDAARSRARAQLETVRAELSRRREDRLRELQQQLDGTITQMLAAGDADGERRREQREARTHNDAARAATLIERGCDLWVRIVREGVSPRSAP